MKWTTVGCALVLLSGCGAFEMRAPRAFVPRTVEKDGVRVAESTFESADGWVHFERSWRPQGDARGMLIVVHGLKDHSARYADFAVGLAKRGFSVRSYDHRGHGRSDGKSQRVDDFDDFITDLDSFVQRSKQVEPKVPVFVLGHSMGGAIATGYALDHQKDIAGLLLSAPALAADASGAARFGAHVASTLFPGAGAAALPIDKFSRSPEVIAQAKNDPLVDLSDVPARTIAGLLDTMDRIAENRSKFVLPILGMHGKIDEITLPSGTKEFLGGVSSKDRTLWMCPKLVHDLLHEPEGAAMADGVARWLEAHTTENVDGAAAALPPPTPCDVVPF
ncbi:alpha/beta hydrolase [Polyangium sorediatum]|uniref:Alpha/beta hydrolase n=1 Tax=Polyangium sorediatum TaxID=889274 RepID=A0ABT6P5G9_9BACT|nr:alpha/beta hydrolase [Polyangium sorediatum]MDI1435803.1 alpha/beta hydrolase [Polyangium sorediatum]